MKIAVFHELPPGGALRAAEQLAVQLRHNHHVTMFSLKEERSQVKGIKQRILHDFLDMFLLQQKHKKLAKEIDSQDFDLVLVHPSHRTQAPFLLSFLKTPSIYYCQEPLRLVHDPFISDISSMPLLNRVYESLNRAWRGWIDKENTQCAYLLLANSHFSKNWIRSVYSLDSHVCYLGVDTHLFTPKNSEKIYDVLFLGAPVDIEGYSLLEDAKQYQKAKWKIHIVARKGNGKGISDSDLIRTIQESRLVVCLSRNEPFGLTVLEAAACGVPVIAVREGGFIESVSDLKNGILINRDPQELAIAIDSLLLSPAKMKEFGQKGRRGVLARWTWEKSAQRLEETLHQVKKSSENGRSDVSSLLRMGFGWYIGLVMCLLFILRFGFRPLRLLFPASPIIHGVVGYAQYTGYPFSFETYLFFFIFLLPIGLAFILGKLKKRSWK